MKKKAEKIEDLIYKAIVISCKLCNQKFWAKGDVNVCDNCKQSIVYNYNYEKETK